MTLIEIEIVMALPTFFLGFMISDPLLVAIEGSGGFPPPGADSKVNPAIHNPPIANMTAL
jgi:hypothetical protein